MNKEPKLKPRYYKENKSKPEKGKKKKKKKIKSPWKLFKRFFNKRIRKVDWTPVAVVVFIVILTTCVSTLLSTLATTAIIKNQEKIEDIFLPIKERNFSLAEKFNQLKESHNYYTNIATKDELLSIWVKNFSEIAIKEIKTSIDAIKKFFRKMNSNCQPNSVRDFIKTAQSLAERGELEIRRSSNKVKSGDLIIIQNKKNNPSHIGIVYDVKNEYIQYMDVNGKVNGWGMNAYKWGDWHIYNVYEVSISLWLGDMMRKLNEVNK